MPRDRLPGDPVVVDDATVVFPRNPARVALIGLLLRAPAVRIRARADGIVVRRCDA